MKNSMTRSHLLIALILGSVWGFAEVLVGAGLRSCAHLVSGSLMTGVALFFLATTWVATRNLFALVLIVMLASIFKLFDAVLLSLPVMHGAIGNPIFAFLLEGLAFIALIAIFRNVSWKKTSSRSLLGGGSALIAVAMFPLVIYATGIPACVYPNSMVPLSILFAPVAIVFSIFTVPLGFLAGNKIEAFLKHLDLNIKSRILRYMASPMTLVLFLAAIGLFRMFTTSNY